MRSLVESDEYGRCCADIEPDTKRLDEVMRYPLYAVSKDPEQFPLVPGTKLRRVKTNEFPGAPALLMYFSIEGATKCVLHSLELLPDDPELSYTFD